MNLPDELQIADYPTGLVERWRSHFNVAGSGGPPLEADADDTRTSGYLRQLRWVQYMLRFADTGGILRFSNMAALPGTYHPDAYQHMEGTPPQPIPQDKAIERVRDKHVYCSNTLIAYMTDLHTANL